MGWWSVPNAFVISHLPKRGKVEVWVFLKLGRAGWVDRLVAVLAGGCACWWLCLLVALLAAEVGGCAARQSMRLWLSCQCDVLILA